MSARPSTRHMVQDCQECVVIFLAWGLGWGGGGDNARLDHVYLVYLVYGHFTLRDRH